MIYLICREAHRYTSAPYFDHLRRTEGLRICVWSYEEAFRTNAVPVGHLIFADLDRLTPYLREAAARMALSLQQAVPEAAVLNHPARALERYPLLRALEAAGINSFTAARLDEGRPPERYPVFIRLEAEALGPESALLEDRAAYEAALARMEREGRPLKGRLWVEYRAERDARGRFRKYGAFRIGGRTMGHHIHVADDWMVKSVSTTFTEVDIADELAFVTDNPHADVLDRACRIAGLDYGRIDYALVGGRVEIYEMNTNPVLPKMQRRNDRHERRAIARANQLAALQALDRPLAQSGYVTFHLPEPVYEEPPCAGRSPRLWAIRRFRARSPKSARWGRAAG